MIKRQSRSQPFLPIEKEAVNKRCQCFLYDLLFKMNERLLDDHALVIGIAVRATIRGNLVAVDLAFRRAGRAIRHAALLASLHVPVVFADWAMHRKPPP